MNKIFFGFDKAIIYLKQGLKIARKNWKNKYIIIIKSYKTYNDNLSSLIVMRHINDKLTPWNPSQDDMLSEDWNIIK